ncbi:MAG: GIY-YIG nuclease family protein [Promethearchaeota archaeon]
MPSFYVYILECIDKKKKKNYYTGYTQDLKKRFDLHRTGKGARYTKGKELTLLHTEFFSTRSEAMARELEIKKMTKKQKKELIQRGTD